MRLQVRGGWGRSVVIQLLWSPGIAGRDSAGSEGIECLVPGAACRGVGRPQNKGHVQTLASMLRSVCTQVERNQGSESCSGTLPCPVGSASFGIPGCVWRQVLGPHSTSQRGMSSLGVLTVTQASLTQLLCRPPARRTLLGKVDSGEGPTRPQGISLPWLAAQCRYLIPARARPRLQIKTQPWTAPPHRLCWSVRATVLGLCDPGDLIAHVTLGVLGSCLQRKFKEKEKDGKEDEKEGERKRREEIKERRGERKGGRKEEWRQE